jgi:proline dehydrogenase
MAINFDNTSIAFQSLNSKELKKAHLLFKLLSSPTLVSIGKVLTLLAFKLHLPVKGIIKKTIFSRFCGGETIEECNNRIAALAKFGIGTILDYSVEGKQSESDLDETTREIIRTTKTAQGNAHVPFCVFKVSGIARFSLLEKVSAKIELTDGEKQEYLRVVNRVDSICKNAFEADTPVFIDAEESWIQPAIDALADTMMAKYNKQKFMVYNTIQLYRHDRLDFLMQSHHKARNGGYKLAVKLVRGAYMEKERERAVQKGYASPIQANKNLCDKDYNLALEYCVKNIQDIAVCAGTHNEQSSLFLVDLMHRYKIEKNDKRIYFAQLLGMSDHISYNLSAEGYNVAKYVPYGPVKEVLPYLIRRAQENTSVKGQTGRELALIKKEISRRKLKHDKQ